MIGDTPPIKFTSTTMHDGDLIKCMAIVKTKIGAICILTRSHEILWHGMGNILSIG
jgi:hypothetical protein